MKLKNSYSAPVKLLVIMLALATLAPSLTPSQAAASDVAAGSPCKNLNEKQTVKGVKFTCIKSGGKRVWKMDSSSTPGPNVPSLDVETCKIQEVSRARGQTGAGFPAWNSLTPKTGNATWALIPLQFSDLKGDAGFANRMKPQMQLLSEWYSTVSQGKFSVSWKMHDKWVTLPGKSSDYKIPFSDSPDRSPEIAAFWKKAIVAADEQFDFTGIQVVNFILPLKQEVVVETLQGFPWDKAVKEHVTAEGPVASFSIPGKFFNQPGRTYWSYWAHEFGHAIGLPHIGSSRAANEFHQYDLMGSQDGPTRELSGWLRFFGEWLNDNQVYCQDASTLQSLELSLVPLNSKQNGTKLAVIKLSNTNALIIESRRNTKFYCKGAPKANGVLAYIYEATLGHGEEFLIPLAPEGRRPVYSACGTPPAKDHILRSGQLVRYKGLEVKVIASGSYDRVIVSKSK